MPARLSIIENIEDLAKSVVYLYIMLGLLSNYFEKEKTQLASKEVSTGLLVHLVNASLHTGIKYICEIVESLKDAIPLINELINNKLIRENSLNMTRTILKSIVEQTGFRYMCDSRVK